MIAYIVKWWMDLIIPLADWFQDHADDPVEQWAASELFESPRDAGTDQRLAYVTHRSLLKLEAAEVRAALGVRPHWTYVAVNVLLAGIITIWVTLLLAGLLAAGVTVWLGSAWLAFRAMGVL